MPRKDTRMPRYVIIGPKRPESPYATSFSTLPLARRCLDRIAAQLMRQTGAAVSWSADSFTAVSVTDRATVTRRYRILPAADPAQGGLAA